MNTSAWQRFNFISANDDGEEDDEEDEGSASEDRWIQWFCRLEGHEFLCEVDPEYIMDAFNLCGLKPKLRNFERAKKMILGEQPSDEEDLMDSEYMDLCRSATDLYGLIHARYIATAKGLNEMNPKYLSGRFGFCPRYYCNNQRVLPVGPSDELHVHHVRIYCPNCQECYDSGCRVDGAFFGSSFPSFFFQAFPSLSPLDKPRPFIPKIFGFRIHNKKSIIQRKLEKGEYGWQVAGDSAGGRRSTEEESNSASSSLSGSSSSVVCALPGKTTGEHTLPKCSNAAV